MPDPDISSALSPGQLLARGVARHLRARNFSCMEEFIPSKGLRVDVMALGPKGELWIVECKSGRADFQTDQKWEGYLEWCDRFFWAVDESFPLDILPPDDGLILSNSFEADIVRMAPEDKLPAARRTALIRKFARDAANRLHSIRDPNSHF